MSKIAQINHGYGLTEARKCFGDDYDMYVNWCSQMVSDTAYLVPVREETYLNINVEEDTMFNNEMIPAEHTFQSVFATSDLDGKLVMLAKEEPTEISSGCHIYEININTSMLDMLMMFDVEEREVVMEYFSSLND